MKYSYVEERVSTINRHYLGAFVHLKSGHIDDFSYQQHFMKAVKYYYGFMRDEEFQHFKFFYDD